jgi:hypothetical protein
MDTQHIDSQYSKRLKWHSACYLCSTARDQFTVMLSVVMLDVLAPFFTVCLDLARGHMLKQRKPLELSPFRGIKSKTETTAMK